MTNKWMSKLTKDFGTLASDLHEQQNKDMDPITLDSPSLNWAVGNGGFLPGKAVILYGAESGGKSLIAILTIIAHQKANPDSIQIVFDAEYSFSTSWFKKLGGNLDQLIVKQTNDPVKIFDFMFEGGELHEMLQDGCPVNCVMIDSIKSIVWPTDIKSKSTNITMGGSGSKFLGSTLKRILPVIREFNISTLLVQQVYEELDQYKAMNNPYKIPDGRNLKHFADYMLEVSKLETKAGRIEVGKTMTGSAQQVGHKVRVKIKKNRCGAPYRVAEFTLDYTQGIANTGEELFELAKSLGVIYHPINEATGKSNVQMWQFSNYDAIRGEANIKKWVVEHPEYHAEIITACNSVGEEIVNARNENMGINDDKIDLG